MRNLFAVSVALVVTTLLFLLMQGLIKDRAHLVDETPAPPVVDVVHVPPDETEPPSDPIDPPEPAPTPPGIPTESTLVQLPEPVTVAFVKPTRGTTPVIKTALAATGEGDPMPIAAFPPQYPRDALIAGIEGWVRIAFTIRADGSVSDASVVDARPRRGVFDTAALDAIARWRFEPRRGSDGEPVSSQAEYTIAFQLADDV